MIEVGDLKFKTQKELENFVREILVNTGANNAISKENEKFFHDLIERHPEKLQKIGSGVKEFRVVQNATNRKALGLDIIRIDGSRIDISWKTCVSGKGATIEKKLKSAMRQAVGEQIRDFRNAKLIVGVLCERCGIKLDGRGHVDHDLTFDLLVKQFLQDFPNYPSDFDDSPDGEMAIFKREHTQYKDIWSSFHKTHAKLLLTCERCNLTRKKSNK